MFDYEKILKETNIEDLNKEIEKNPGNDSTLFLRGLYLVAQGESKFSIGNFISSIEAKVKYKRSLDDFNSAIDINNKEAKYYLNRAFAYHRLQDLECTIDDLDQFVLLDGKKNAFYYDILGTIKYLWAEYDESIEAYTLGLEIDPNNISLLYNRAYANSYRDILIIVKQ